MHKFLPNPHSPPWRACPCRQSCCSRWLSPQTFPWGPRRNIVYEMATLPEVTMAIFFRAIYLIFFGGLQYRCLSTLTFLFFVVSHNRVSQKIGAVNYYWLECHKTCFKNVPTIFRFFSVARSEKSCLTSAYFPITKKKKQKIKNNFTLPKTTCLPSNQEVFLVVMKNWDPLVSLPELAMDSQPAP